MAIVSSLTINNDTRDIADVQSRQDIAALRADLAQEISDRTDAMVSLMNLITQSNSDNSIGWKIPPSFSINGNGHLIVTFED